MSYADGAPVVGAGQNFIDASQPKDLRKFYKCILTHRRGNTSHGVRGMIDLRGRGNPVAAKSERLSLRAVITQTDDQFIVSVTLLSPQEPPTIVGEQSVATIDAAHDFIEQLARKMGHPPKDVEKLYNLPTGITTRPPKPKRK